MNQHSSPKARILALLGHARAWLSLGRVPAARHYLRRASVLMGAAPASTRRRWKTGR